MAKKKALPTAGTFDIGFADDFSDFSDNTEAQKTKQPKRKKQKRQRSFGHSLKRFITMMIIFAFIVLNVWLYIDLFRFSMLVISVDINKKETNMFVSESDILTTDVLSFGLSETLGLSETVIEWTSDNAAVASVNEYGEITANEAGQATITATEAKSGISSSCSVTVHSLTDIVLNATEYKMGVSEPFALEATIISKSEFAEPFEFYSSDDSVVSVDGDGIITAHKPGEAVVTVNARGYNSSECKITVFNTPTMLIFADDGGICLDEKRKLATVVGENEYCADYTYTSSDPSVLSIDKSGNMKAHKTGSATITATTYNDISYSLEYTVVGQPKSLKLDKTKHNMYTGQELVFTPRDSTKSCREYYYTSSDNNVISISEDGTITACGKGSAVITCSTYNGKTAECKVNVDVVNYIEPYISERVYRNIAELEKAYPELISTEVIGQSVNGRDITLVKLGKGERKAVIVAGIHSRENITVTFTMRCLEEYAEAYSSRRGYYGNYNIRNMLDDYTLYIVPLMNPDGLDISTNGDMPLYTTEAIDAAKYKNNANGVNLNRNFPFMWGYSDEKSAVNTTTPDTDSYAGTAEASEPETQAIVELCRSNEFEWLLDMHCRGHMIFYQDKFNEVTEADNRLAARLAKHCEFSLNDRSTAYEVSGGMENWFRQEFGRPGICIELVKSNYAYNVNHKFDAKLEWEKTKYIFILCMKD